MNELLDTERVYVEELLCVLEVSLPWADGQACAVGWDSPRVVLCLPPSM